MNPLPRLTPAAPAPGPAPTINPFGRGVAMAMYGPDAADRMLEREQAPWRGQVAAYLVDQLFGGGRNHPISTREIYSGVAAMAPQLLGHKGFMKQLLAVGAEHNSSLAVRDKNLLASLLEFGGDVPQEVAQGLYARTGYRLPGLAPAQAAAGLGLAPTPAVTRPGTMLVPPKGRVQPQAAAGLGLAPTSPVTRPVSDARQQLFGGLAPSAGATLRLPSKTERETARARAIARAQQQEQTVGFRRRRGIGQKMPPGKYVTTTDPRTGRKKEVWTGGRSSIDLGRAPYSVGDLRAQVLRKAREAVAAGKRPDEVLNSVEMEIYRNTTQAMTGWDLLKILGRRLAPTAPGKQLSEAQAREYLKRAGGDKAKARELARADGYSF